ncbi:hypothetical protein DM01DRAFT_1336697, partial [Hesseltinella vesiculosa]
MATSAKKKQSTRQRALPARKRKQILPSSHEASDSSEASNSDDDDFEPVPEQFRKKKKAKRVQIQSDSDSESDMAPSNRKAKRSTKKAMPESCQDSSDNDLVDSPDKTQLSKKEPDDTEDDISNKDPDSGVEEMEFKPALIKVPVPVGSPFADAVHPATLEFLALLKANNEREFYLAHQDMWKAAKQDFMDFVDTFAKELHSVDSSTHIEPSKNAMYRLHRDLRFTNDRSPYKTRLMASFTTAGKRSPLPGYHLIIEPGGESRLAAGVVLPPSHLMQRMRRGIVRQADLLRESLATDTMKEIFGEDNVGTKLLMDRDMLKVAPKGYEKDHPEITLLRYNSLCVSKRFTDEQVVSQGFLDDLLDVAEAFLPFVTILNAWMV